MFSKKSVLRNFAIFTEKHLCQSLFFNKIACLRPATFLKMILWHSCFLVNFAKFLRTPFIMEHLWWLLQKFMELIFLENALIQGIFTHTPPHSKFAPKFLSSHARQKEITHSLRQHSLENLFPPTAESG